MRTPINLSDAQIRALDGLSREEKRSRASPIRQAIDEYLDKRRQEANAFGLWGNHKVDGLAYQEEVRRTEW